MFTEINLLHCFGDDDPTLSYASLSDHYVQTELYKLYTVSVHECGPAALRTTWRRPPGTPRLARSAGWRALRGSARAEWTGESDSALGLPTGRQEMAGERLPELPRRLAQGGTRRDISAFLNHFCLACD